MPDALRLHDKSTHKMRPTRGEPSSTVGRAMTEGRATTRRSTLAAVGRSGGIERSQRRSVVERVLWAVAVGLIAGSAAIWALGRFHAAPARYMTAQVERGSIEQTVSAIGSVQPLQYVDVGTQVTGQLKTLYVEVGSKVSEGQLVAEIDPSIFAARVDATRATLQSLHAQLAEKVAQQRLARQVHARNRELLKSDAASKEAVQQSASAEEQAAAQVASFKAQIAQEQSQLQADETNLRYTKIHSPIAGTVVSLTVRQGQTLVASQQAPTILRVADLSTMTVWAQVSEADEPKIRVGMPVYFNTLGQTERRWNGNVRQVLPTPETVNNVVLYDVLFDVQNPDLALKPQMSTQVYFVVAQADNALVVPVAALRPSSTNVVEAAPGAGVDVASSDGGTIKVRPYTVHVLKDGKLHSREVAVGIRTRLWAQVVSGLSEGETIAVALAGENDADRQSKAQARPIVSK
jgi:membrane fusion protein, macrolide-specific efflux system